MSTTLIAPDIDARLARFTAHVEPLGATVTRVPGSADAAEFIADVAADIEAPNVIAANDLVAVAPALAAAGANWIAAGAVSETRDQPLGVSLAILAIAETGSVMLAERTLEDRAVGLLTRTHITIVRTSDLVPSLAEAAATMREVALRPGGGYGSFVTGPSRTADIEMSLTVGVQGPARVYILFVDDLQ
ncbi:MAG: LUD domain-containing protein [Thermomicrobiales bacterium]|nr:LUD domain-containing protein [Thermomicrobiales bacterium]